MVLYVHSAAAAFIICAVTALPISIEVSQLHVYINSSDGGDRRRRRRSVKEFVDHWNACARRKPLLVDRT